jgi:hypothetical protein
MAIPSVGGGYQVGDGNLNEVTLGDQGTVATATVTATLTVAQITAGILSANTSTTAASLTLPTGALIDATLTNAKVGSTFDFYVISTSTGVGTLTVNTGWTLVGSGLTTASGFGAQFRARKTGDGTYTCYRVA